MRFRVSGRLGKPSYQRAHFRAATVGVLGHQPCAREHAPLNHKDLDTNIRGTPAGQGDLGTSLGGAS